MLLTQFILIGLLVVQFGGNRVRNIMSKCEITRPISLITLLILLPEKFLPFEWLTVEVFQLNLKYLHAKITVTVTMVTQNHQKISSHELRKNGGKISRF